MLVNKHLYNMEVDKFFPDDHQYNNHHIKQAIEKNIPYQKEGMDFICYMLDLMKIKSAMV